MRKQNLFTRLVGKRLGEILIESGVIHYEHINKALTLQKARGEHVLSGEVLRELGFVTEEEILQTIMTQYDMPFISVDNYDIDPLFIQCIPFEIADRYNLIPICKIGNVISIAMSNPLDTKAIKEVEAASQCCARLFITTRADIRRAIDKYYIQDRAGLAFHESSPISTSRINLSLA